ncbi:MAG: DUF1501 domain-containing protein [Thermoanaerobaculia bacterium]
MKPSRREFLARSSCTALGIAAMTSGLEKLGLIDAYANAAISPLAPTNYRALVCIFLNGGNDSNNMIVPTDATGYGDYSSARAASGLAISQGTLQQLPVTPAAVGTEFGFHPSLPELRTLFTQNRLAVVCNVGPLVEPLTKAQYQSGGKRPYQLFSHSDQVTQWLTARADTKAQVGWGGRAGDFASPLNGTSNFPMITSITGSSIFNIGLIGRPLAISPAPTTLPNVLALSGFNATPESVARRTSFNNLRTYDLSQDLIEATSVGTQQALDVSASFSTDPVPATVFPNTTLGNQLKQVAKIIRLNQTSPSMNLNRQIFFVSLGGFDTHSNQLASQVSLFTQLSQAMKAFYDETVAIGVPDRVTTFTLSDFGRTLQPSGSGAGVVGSDHAWGSHQFVMGNAVSRGDFFGVAPPGRSVFPVLKTGASGPDDTDTRGRWIPTVAVEQYAATLASWYGVPNGDLATVFPLLSRFTPGNLGFLLP